MYLRIEHKHTHYWRLLCGKKKWKKVVSEGLNPLTLEIGYPKYMTSWNYPRGYTRHDWKVGHTTTTFGAMFGSIAGFYYDSKGIIKRVYHNAR